MSEQKIHPSHKTRTAFDASTYDIFCEQCGCTDQVPGGLGKLVDPCPAAETRKGHTKITIECEMKDRWVPQFLALLQRMQFMGNMGSSRTLGFYADGDGDFRPKFTVDGKNIKDMETANPVYDDDCRSKNAICDVFYDAG